jgi:menaquinone-9 beta-reductase
MNKSKYAGHMLDRLPAKTDWDCIVLGAGPAGSTVAIQLARHGYSTLLVEKKQFPRQKVCGGCLSGKAVLALRQLSLFHVLKDAIPLNSFVLSAHGRSATLACNGGFAISRSTFDQRLTEEAMRDGATFLHQTTATLGVATDTHRLVDLTSHGQSAQFRAKLVIVCTGLGNPDQKKLVPLEEVYSHNSRIGLTTLAQSNREFKSGTICMSVDRVGYLGITTLENGQLNLSACVKRQAVQESGSPTEYALTHLERLGLSEPEGFSESRWLGTPRLTRKLKNPAGERVFVLGDAAKYVEPFTGEGISWALESSIQVQPFARKAIQAWDHSLINAWARSLTRLLHARQRVCYAMKIFAGHPRLIASTIPLLKRMPLLAKPFITAIHGNTK